MTPLRKEKVMAGEESHRSWDLCRRSLLATSEHSHSHSHRTSLKLRETKLCNGSLYNGEAWSSISDRDMSRLQQVDLSFLRGLTCSHARTTSEFYYLELGILTFKHILTIRSLIYHHHILTRDESETILKISRNQKESHYRGD